MSEQKHANGNGWNEYEKHVLSEIKRIAKNTDDIRIATDKSNIQFVTLISQVEIRVLNQIGKINQEIAALKVKAGIWGICGGMGAIIVALGIFIVREVLAAPH